MPARLTIRLDFPGGRLGPGKIALLEAIARHGSIAAAGREHRMSYRRAWTLIDEVNRMFTGPLVASKPGGKDGGGAALTPLGLNIVAAYRAAEEKMRASATAEIAEISDAITEG